MVSHALDGPTISNITSKEKEITGEARPVKGGPTAQAQKHTGEAITDATVSAIAGGERAITHEDARRADGPTAFVESLASGQEAPATTTQHTGKLDDSTISAIAEAEKRITGQDDLVEGGPTAQAQEHAGEPINRASLHDITEGEKTITHEVSAVKGGPTAITQGELNLGRSMQALYLGEDDLKAATIGPLALHPAMGVACMATSRMLASSEQLTRWQ
ncbi:hypothetical protein DL762_005754 [Monosporascus cannonballus]|uniref:SMP domain-containing protein n=1 Tax=Monosporascus cannonballus TaxID=155416 RepID=A0ABY0H401_9PEZI|nr:hypothetical protein DL762_005754 [Monosporascus cannonballus]